MCKYEVLNGIIYKDERNGYSEVLDAKVKLCPSKIWSENAPSDDTRSGPSSDKLYYDGSSSVWKQALNE